MPYCCHDEKGYRKTIVMKKHITPKNLCIGYIIILLGVLIFKDYSSYVSFYSTHKGMIDILLQIMVFLAAACAAFANIKMMKSNNIMASVASEEIETLKRQHDYSIAPILHFIGYEQSVNNVNIKNGTTNLTIKLTIFAKLNGEFFISTSHLLEAEEKISTDLFLTTDLKTHFDNIYGQEKKTFKGLENKLKNFLENDNWFFAIYVDVEGKIHGTSLRCTREVTPIAPHLEEFYRSRYTEAEIIRFQAGYTPYEQLFYIMSDEKLS